MELEKVLDLTKEMRVEIPEKPELYHEEILKLHKYLNDLTDLYAEVSKEILVSDDKKQQADLKTILNVLKDRKSQLSITKQMFNMIINKGSKYEDPPKPRKDNVSSDVPGQKSINELDTSNSLDFDDLGVLESPNQDDFEL